MPTQVTCPNPQCRKQLTIKEDLSGRTLRCPACKSAFSLPAASGEGTASSATKSQQRSTKDSSQAQRSTQATPPGKTAPPSVRVPPAAKSAASSADPVAQKGVRKGVSSDLPPAIGPYRISRELGRGAFGVVYQGHDPRLKRDVAIKVLNRDALHSAKAVERFLREAQVVAQMHHNHIVPVYELGEHEGRHYIASRFVKGQTLSRLIPEEGMDPVQAVGLVVQLLEGLAYAHKQGVLHRDVKPANAIVDSEGQLYLMDFGLAGWVGQGEERATQDGTVLGTPAYMPPEQARGDIQEVCEASDQYSAGVLLYELLTGHLPFEGARTHVLLYNVIHTPPPPLTSFRPDLDPQLEAICLQALAKEIPDRFPGCRELADTLRAWQAFHGTPGPITVATVIAPGQSSAGVQTLSATSQATTGDEQIVAEITDFLEPAAVAEGGSRRTWLVLGLVGLLLCVGLAIFLIVHFSKSDAPTSDPIRRGILQEKESSN